MQKLIMGDSDVFIKKRQIPSLIEKVFGITSYRNTNDYNLQINTYFDYTTADYLIKIKNKENLSNHVFYDTVRGKYQEIEISNKPQSIKTNGLTLFTSSGFKVGNSLDINKYNSSHTAITFKKASKFFDIVKYTGNGVKNRVIAHQLGCEIGLISIKALDIYSNWIVRHKDAIGELSLDNNSPQENVFSKITDISDTHFSVSENANLISVEYVAYIFAHDSSLSSKIQCGSYVGGYQDITNTVVGSGIIDIPLDVTEITITAKGGTGGNNCWYDPGQPYVKSTLEQAFVPAVYAWKYIDDYSITNSKTIDPYVWNSYNHVRPYAPVELPTKVSDPSDPSTLVYVNWWTGTQDKAVFWSGHYAAYLVSEETPFKEAIPEKPYIAPTSGGSVFKGNFSTVRLNDQDYTFEGGEGGPAVPEILNIDLRNCYNRILSYNISEGGSLTYSYKTGSQTEVSLKFKQPPIKFSTILMGKNKLLIPKNITNVKIECSGGVGGNDAWSDPGKPYVAKKAAVAQVGLPQYPDGLPYYIAHVKEVRGQGIPSFPDGLPYFIAPVTGSSEVHQQGLPEYPDGLPPYYPEIPAGTPVGEAEYPNGLPPYVPGHPDLGNPSFPDGLPPYSAGPPVVGNVLYPDGLPPWSPAANDIGVADYPDGLPPYDPGTAGVPQRGLPEYPNGLPVYIKEAPPVAPVAQQGLPLYPDGLPYFIAHVEPVAGQGKYLYPDGLEPFKEAVEATEEQLYVPPSSGGGDTYGETSSISIDNQKFTFPGSFGNVPAEIYIQNIILNGLNSQILDYDIPADGHLNVSYDIPNYDTGIESDFDPYYLIIKKITGNGDWYEIDCTDKDNFFILNNQLPLTNRVILDLKKNGFIIKSTALDELNQHYVYLTIKK